MAQNVSATSRVNTVSAGALYFVNISQHCTSICALKTFYAYSKGCLVKIVLRRPACTSMNRAPTGSSATWERMRALASALLSSVPDFPAATLMRFRKPSHVNCIWARCERANMPTVSALGRVRRDWHDADSRSKSSCGLLLLLDERILYDSIVRTASNLERMSVYRE